MNKLVTCSIDAKRCSKQIVIGAFNEILCGQFKIPSLDEMEKSLEGFIDYTFDEHKEMSTIISKHPGWDEERVKGEVYKNKMKFVNTYRNNLKQPLPNRVPDIENLINDLNNTNKSWKITNLE
jgi:hypothetical protein